MPQSKNPFKRAWDWVKDQIVQEVPKDTAFCEFDCRKQECTLGEWETCEERLHHNAAGELTPWDGDTRQGAS